MHIFSANLLNNGGKKVISSNLSEPVMLSFSNPINLIPIVNNDNIKFLANNNSQILSSNNGLNYTSLLTRPSDIIDSSSVLIQDYTNNTVGILIYLTNNGLKIGSFKTNSFSNTYYLNYSYLPTDCIYTNNKYYLITQDNIYDSWQNYLFIGTNVSTWGNPILLPNIKSPFTEVTYGNDLIVISDTAGFIYTNNNGQSFSQYISFPTEKSNSRKSLLYNNGYFYLLGSTGIYKTTNLLVWTKIYDSTATYRLSGTFGFNKLLLASANGVKNAELYSSLDFVNYKHLGTLNSYNTIIAYSNNIFSIISGNKSYNLLWGLEE